VGTPNHECRAIVWYQPVGEKGNPKPRIGGTPNHEYPQSWISRERGRKGTPNHGYRRRPAATKGNPKPRIGGCPTEGDEQVSPLTGEEIIIGQHVAERGDPKPRMRSRKSDRVGLVTGLRPAGLGRSMGQRLQVSGREGRRISRIARCNSGRAGRFVGMFVSYSGRGRTPRPVGLTRAGPTRAASWRRRKRRNGTGGEQR
jgi:hypothetical protein